MKTIYLILLIVFIAAITIFAIQNLDTHNVQFLHMSVQAPLAAVIAVAYILGMITGWSVFGFIRRSVKRVTERKKE